MATPSQTFWNVGIGATTFGPLLVITGLMMVNGWLRFRGTRSPVKDKLLRAPGESLRREIDKFEEHIFDSAFKVFVFGIAFSVVFAVYAALCSVSPHFSLEIAVFFLLLLVATAVIARRAIAAVNRHWNNLLGFRGERAVGEELNRMMLDGCRVYHDVPGDGAWNIDHVIVAPNGVFAVETKTRRKGKCAPGKEDHKVEFDGTQLDFPFGYDTHGIEQARNNAKWLSEFLSKALAEPIAARPILTLPGWFVTSRVSPDESGIAVVNPKGIPAAVRGARGQRLTDKQIQQIAFQLEQRCRDVEF